MLLKAHGKIINLNQFDLVKAEYTTVLALRGSYGVEIAALKSENDALALQEAIFSVWSASMPAFDVNKWCSEHNVAMK